ncbi:MAG: hypothetical protein ACQERD_05575 [Campylobacterota bacterium]
MEGKILVTYKILCKSDFNLEVSLEKLLENERVAKAIKTEFAKGIRNIGISTDSNDSNIKLQTNKELYEFEARKDDFADLVTLAEEDATARKIFKKDCIGVELVDIETFSK